jgi:hypothetical protein
VHRSSRAVRIIETASPGRGRKYVGVYVGVGGLGGRDIYDKGESRLVSLVEGSSGEVLGSPAGMGSSEDAVAALD